MEKTLHGMAVPYIIGHRGAAEAPENTLPSFKESLRQGAQMLELDVRLTRDEIPVVIHDSTFKRITGGKPGGVATRTLKHIRTLDASSGHDPHYRGTPIPTLEETLTELCPQCPINIEMKFNRPSYRPLTEAVAAAVKTLHVERQVFVSSFWHQSLELLRRRVPGILTAPLFGSETGPPHREDVDEVLAGPLREERPGPGEVPFRGRMMVTSYRMATAELADALHQGEGCLIVYTVDDPADVRRMAEIGVDAIITNRPGIAREALRTLLEPRSRVP